MKFTWIVGIFLLLVLVFFIADCSAGHNGSADCVVSYHEHIDEWVETWTDTDDKGHVHWHTTRHPEEWHIHCIELHGDSVFDIETTHAQYITVTNSENVAVLFRKGRWTGIKYLSEISEYRGVER